MISNKKTIAIAGITVLVLAVAGPILADIVAMHQAQAMFFRGGFGRGFGFGGFGRGFGFGGFPGWGWGGGWGGWGGGCGCCGGGWW
jgi:hypothetical protein